MAAGCAACATRDARDIHWVEGNISCCGYGLRRQSSHGCRSAIGIPPGEFRVVTRSHVIAWRDDLVRRALSGMTVRHRLAALSSLFEHLCESNAVIHNPVKGVKQPQVESYQGKTPALGEHQARALLEAPDSISVKGKRDRSILATLRSWAGDDRGPLPGRWQSGWQPCLRYHCGCDLQDRAGVLGQAGVRDRRACLAGHCGDQHA